MGFPKRALADPGSHWVGVGVVGHNYHRELYKPLEQLKRTEELTPPPPDIIEDFGGPPREHLQNFTFEKNSFLRNSAQSNQPPLFNCKIAKNLIDN